jgi:sigma-B regulation protein RsbU (phosphoserine phosphatase)
VPSEVFQSGRAQYFEDFSNEVPNPENRHSVVLRLRRVFCVPLVAFDLVDDASSVVRDRRIGVLYLDSQRKSRLVSAPTRSALEALATNAAIGIENARLYREAAEKARMEHEMRLAAEIQQLLLPRGSHVTGWCHAVGLTQPCRSIAGDFFDYAELPDGRLAFAVGDVAGKGPPAALLSTLVLGMLADQRRDQPSPAESVARLNDALGQRAIEARYVTLVCGQLTPQGRLTYCNAGHNPPVVVGRGGVRRLEVGGPPAGMFEGGRFEEEVVLLGPGDRVVVYTDGVSEAQDRAGEEFGEQRLVEVVRGSGTLDAPGLVEAIVRSVRSFASGVSQADDITALVIAYLGWEPSRRSRAAGREP